MADLTKYDVTDVNVTSIIENEGSWQVKGWETGLLVFMTLAGLSLTGFLYWKSPVSPPPTLTQIHAVAALVASLVPFLCGVVVVLRFYSRETHFRLVSRHHCEQPWQRVAQMVRYNWRYEGGRFGRTLARLPINSLGFGTLGSLGLSTSFILFALGAGRIRLQMFALSFGIATATGFTLQFVRLVVRIAGQDFTARMFAWATRSLAYIMLGDAFLVVIMQGDAPTWTGKQVSLLILTGLVVAVLGEKAVELVIVKAAALVGLKVPTTPNVSPLSGLDGIMDADVERFAEEGVVSLQDLAFTPTARLFFNTSRSLQHICDWQDQALLRVYFGELKAKALADQLSIRGVIDLQDFAQQLRGQSVSTPCLDCAPSTTTTPPHTTTTFDESTTTQHDAGAAAQETTTTHQPAASVPATDKHAARMSAVSKALGVDTAALEVLLGTIVDDETTLRLRIYWESTPSLIKPKETPQTV
jgi:hypothetical protein